MQQHDDNTGIIVTNWRFALGVVAFFIVNYLKENI